MKLDAKKTEVIAVVILILIIWILDVLLRQKMPLNEAVWPAVIAAAGTLAGAGASEASESAANKRQYKYGQLAAREADRRQRQMYEDYGTWSAQRKQMEAAGINPGLLYGQGGGGGQNIPEGGKAAPEVNARGVNHNASIQTGLQTGLLEAQIENINADTENKKADAENKVADTGVKYTQMSLIGAQTNSERAKFIGIELDNIQKDFINGINEKTRDSQVEYIQSEATYMSKRVISMIKEIEGQEIENSKKEELIDATIAKYKADVAAQVQAIVESNSRTKLNEEQLKYVKDWVDQGWENAASNRFQAGAAQKMGSAAIQQAAAAKKNAETLAGQLALDQEYRTWDTVIDGIEAVSAGFGTVVGAGILRGGVKPIRGFGGR